MTVVLLGLGSNQGDPLSQLLRAMERIETVMRVEDVSNVYRTEPVGNVEQPDFFNISCLGHTDLSATVLHAKLAAIELKLGRRRSVPNGPRTIDIDLLAFGELVLDSPDLVVPHPRMHRRAFVLAPLAEIAPEWRHPVLGATVVELLAGMTRAERVERWGPLRPDRPDAGVATSR